MAQVQEYLEQYNIPFQILKKQNEIPNLITQINSNKANKKLLFNGHLDFLPVNNLDNWSDNPFSGKVKDGKIFGRGAADMKGGIVAMLSLHFSIFY